MEKKKKKFNVPRRSVPALQLQFRRNDTIKMANYFFLKFECFTSAFFLLNAIQLDQNSTKMFKHGSSSGLQQESGILNISSLPLVHSAGHPHFSKKKKKPPSTDEWAPSSLLLRRRAFVSINSRSLMRKKSITSRHTPNGCSATWFLWSNIFVRFKRPFRASSSETFGKCLHDLPNNSGDFTLIHFPVKYLFHTKGKKNKFERPWHFHRNY